MKFASLNDLYLQQLKDLHSAESQLIKALPKMAKAARNPDLRNAFIEHLEQTKGHLDRLKQVAEKLGKRLAGHTCAAMKGLICWRRFSSQADRYFRVQSNKAYSKPMS